MGEYKFSKENLGKVLEALKDYKVYAPQKKADVVRFQELSDPSEITLEFTNTNVPPKEIMFPQTETLFRFKVGGQDIEPRVPEPTDKMLVFGLRPCDARAYSIVDKLWQWDFIDPYVKNRRESSTIVGFACSEPCANCFCTSLGGGPADEENLDAILFDLGEVFYLKTITEKGDEFVQKCGEALESAGDVERKNAQAQGKEAIEKIRRSIEVEGISEKLPGLFNDAIWKEFSSRCLGCGICTYLCPTCHCFDIQDETEALDGRRARMWDTCMFAEYTLHASGHNPRPTRAERTRNRISHKYSYFPEKFGVVACVGCGRCINFCPVNIDILDILGKVKEA